MSRLYPSAVAEDEWDTGSRAHRFSVFGACESTHAHTEIVNEGNTLKTAIDYDKQ